MNVYDSQRIEEVLLPLGFVSNLSLQGADMVILNTCHIRAKAEDKLFSDLGRFRILKQARKLQDQPMVLIVAGCVGQALGKAILERAPYVDAIIGPQTYHTLPEIIAKVLRNEGQHVVLGFPKISKFDELTQPRVVQGASAFLSIQEGCNKFCRYCVVPYTRGPEYSRPINDLKIEARQLVSGGVKEITLLGQNVNAYHGHDDAGKVYNLAKLIYALAEISGLERIRYSSSHPRDVDDELIEAHRDVKTLMPLVHLPIQSGSDKILANMNRQYTQRFYLDLIEKFSAANGNLAFASDFIVGYPGETDEDFQATCDVVEAVAFAQAYSFKYSPRPGTPAASLPQVDESIKKERLACLQDLINKKRADFNNGFVGQEVSVLVDDLKDGKLVGKSPFMQMVHFIDPCGQKGDIITARIEKSSPHSLWGSVKKS